MRHDDLHPGNLLIRLGNDDRIELFLIDLHGVRMGRPLSWRASRGNLVILNRWFSIRSNRADRRRAWRAYWQERLDLGLEERVWARGMETATRTSFVAFGLCWLDRRCMGGNRHFRKVRAEGVTAFAVADLADAALVPLLASPDDLFDRSGAKVLKKSASSAVVEMELLVAGRMRRVIGKRLNATAWSDPLAVLVRPTGVLRSWVLGHGLRFRGLPTPRPLAMWQRTRLGMPTEGYVVMEKVPGAVEPRTSFVRWTISLPGSGCAGCVR